MLNCPPRFAVNLKAARTDARISQEELSERCGVHRTEVNRLERGQGSPRLGTLIRLASVLGVGVDRLCAGMSWDEDAQRFVVDPPSAST